MYILIHWLIFAVAIAATAYILPGVGLAGTGATLITALVLGIVNALIRPILYFLALPITFLTLGLFALVINAVLVMLVAAIVPGFTVRNFWWAILFSIILALINGVLQSVVF